MISEYSKKRFDFCVVTIQPVKRPDLHAMSITTDFKEQSPDPNLEVQTSYFGLKSFRLTTCIISNALIPDFKVQNMNFQTLALALKAANT